MKKWVVTTLISLLFIIASIVFTFVYLLPKINEKKILEALQNGDKEKTSELMADLSAEDKTKFIDDVKDIVVYTHNQFAAGQKTYEEMFSVYENIESVREYRGLTADSFAIVQQPKLVENYEKSVILYDTGDAYYSQRDLFKDLYRIKNSTGEYILYTWDSAVQSKYQKTVNDVLDDYLQKTYDWYKAGNMGTELVKKYIYTADDFWDTEYVSDMRNKIYYEDIFTRELEKIDSYAGEQKYFSALSYLDSVREYYENNDYYADWKDTFDKKCEELETTAKQFYPELAIEYIYNGDKASAETIVNQLKERFGDDFDVSAIEAASLTEWQMAYLTFMNGWESKVEEDYKYSNDQMNDTDVYDFSEIKPDRILLMDVNGDDVPELIFDNGKNQSFVYSYMDGGCEYFCYFMDYTSIGENGEFIYESEYESDGIWRSFHIVYKPYGAELKVVAYVVDQEAGGDHMYFSGTGDEMREIETAEYYEIVEAVHSLIISEKLPFGAYIDDYDSYIRSGQ